MNKRPKTQELIRKLITELNENNNTPIANYIFCGKYSDLATAVEYGERGINGVTARFCDYANKCGIAAGFTTIERYMRAYNRRSRRVA